MYTVRITPHAQKQLDRLPDNLRTRITQRLLALASTPRPRGVKKLEGREGYYCVRVGAYRVIYDIQDDQLVVLVIRVRHRREAYRR